MNRAGKKILSLGLSVALAIGGMFAAPQAVGAVDIGKADDLTPDVGRTDQATPVGDLIYFGEWEGSPVKWRVVQNSSGTITLFCDGDVGNKAYDSNNNNGAWSGSEISHWLNGTAGGSYDFTANGFLPTAFTNEERMAMVTQYSTTPENDYGVDITPSQTIVLPSYTEVFTGWSMTQSDRAYSNHWWLRSPAGIPYNAACCNSDGSGATYFYVSYPWAIRPAFKLNLSSVLFTSAAAGGKSSGAAGDPLSSAQPTAQILKLTVLDSGQTLDVVATNDQAAQQNKANLEFSYQSATSGTDQYISCVLTQGSGVNEAVKYYGKLVDMDGGSASGTLSVPLSGVANGAYTLKIFSEQVNGDNYTDYASTPVEMTVTVGSEQGTISGFTGTILDAPIIDTNPSSQTVTEGNAATFTVTASGDHLSYQWQDSTDNGGTFNNISGATGASYTIPAATLGMSGNQYRAVVSNISGAATSSAATLTVNVKAPDAALAVDTMSNDTAVEGESYSKSIPATYTNGTGSLGYSTSSTLPLGLSLNQTTGVISGTPEMGTASTYPITVSVTDGTLTATGSYTLTVTDAASPTQLTLATPTDLTVAEGEPFTKTLDVSYTGVDTLVYGATGLPSGVSINTSTGVISGAADAGTAGEHTIDITVTDNNGNNANASFTLWVTPDITFSAVAGGVDLNNPSDLVFQADNAAPLSAYDFFCIRIENSAGQGYNLYPSDGVAYDPIAGTVTLPAAMFSQHQGNPLTEGTYTAVITFGDDPSNPTFTFDYIVTFALTSGSGGTTYPLTVNSGSGGGNYAAGAQVTITANAPASGKVFDKWTGGNGGSFTNAYSASATFTMPAGAATVTATYKNSGGNGNGSGRDDSSSGSDGSSTSSTSGNIICNTIRVPYSKTGGLLSSSVTGRTLRSIVDNAYKAEDGSKTVKLSYGGISGSAGMTRLTLNFDAARLKADEDVAFIVETPFGIFIFTTAQMMEWFDGNAFGSYTITLEKSSLKVDVKKGGKSAVWNELTPMARIGIPYTPKTGEATVSLALTDKNGRVLPTSVYEKGMVYADIFALGTYKAAAITSAGITDTVDHWAKAHIDYVTMRGLISSLDGTAYAPGTAITRADYLMALGKLAGANVSGYKQSSFTDVSDGDAAMPYIEWAYRNKIVEGIGNGKFAPESPITREQMALMMASYAKILGFELPVVNSAAAYADSGKISAWAKDAVTAMQKAGIMTGKDNNLFDPQGSTTRGEAAAILRRFVENVISSHEAEGWSNANNDLNKRVYYTQNGIALTGWQTLGGARYYFNKGGVMRTGWLDLDDKRYCFYSNGKMVAGAWVKIGGKWYYFYDNGVLATSTTIDGYEVGADGARKEQS